MKTLIAFATVLLLVAPAIAQEPSVVVHVTQPVAAAETGIDLSGPDKAKTGEAVTLYLTGTPAIDLTKPLTDQLSWLMGADAMSAHLQVPGQPMSPLDVEGTIVFAASGATLRPQVRFTAGAAGEYRVVVDWNFGQNQLVEHVVVVEGDSPNPFPDPQPGPIPAGTRLALILHESSAINYKQATVAESVRRHLSSRTEGIPCLYRFLDKDTPSQGSWLTPYQEVISAKSLALPVLVVSVLPDRSNNLAAPFIVSAETLPATSELAIKRIEEALK
jgi:hypothetical protein